VARPARKKAKIDEAARRLFSTRGLAATTVKDIAGRAKVAEGALYRHYKGKMDMARRLFRADVEAFAPGLEEILSAGERSFGERVRDAVRYMYRYYRRHPDRFSFIMLAQYEFAGERVLDARYDPNALVVRFVKNAVRSGEVGGGSPEVLAAVLMGAALRPLVMHRRGRLKISLASLEGKVADACARLLLEAGSGKLEAKGSWGKKKTGKP